MSFYLDMTGAEEPVGLERDLVSIIFTVRKSMSEDSAGYPYGKVPATLIH